MKNFFNQPLLNPEHNVNSLREEFEKNRVVVIKDFLNPVIAERLHTWFTEEMPKDWWRISSYPKLDGGDGFDLVPFDDTFSEDIRTMYTHAITNFKDNKFSYNFVLLGEYAKVIPFFFSSLCGIENVNSFTSSNSNSEASSKTKYCLRLR